MKNTGVLISPERFFNPLPGNSACPYPDKYHDYIKTKITFFVPAINKLKNE